MHRRDPPPAGECQRWLLATRVGSWERGQQMGDVWGIGQVESLEHQRIVYVACGGAHTLALHDNGCLYRPEPASHSGQLIHSGHWQLGCRNEWAVGPRRRGLPTRQLSCDDRTWPFTRGGGRLTYTCLGWSRSSGVLAAAWCAPAPCPMACLTLRGVLRSCARLAVRSLQPATATVWASPGDMVRMAGAWHPLTCTCEAACWGVVSRDRVRAGRLGHGDQSDQLLPKAGTLALLSTWHPRTAIHLASSHCCPWSRGWCCLQAIEMTKNEALYIAHMDMGSEHGCMIDGSGTGLPWPSLVQPSWVSQGIECLSGR